MITLVHKNPNIETKIYLYKIQYRDLKRIKMKISLCGSDGFPNTFPFKAEVDSLFFNNFCKGDEIPVYYPENGDLLKLDDEKEDYVC